MALLFNKLPKTPKNWRKFDFNGTLKIHILLSELGKFLENPVANDLNYNSISQSI